MFYMRLCDMATAVPGLLQEEDGEEEDEEEELDEEELEDYGPRKKRPRSEFIHEEAGMSQHNPTFPYLVTLHLCITCRGD